MEITDILVKICDNHRYIPNIIEDLKIIKNYSIKAIPIIWEDWDSLSGIFDELVSDKIEHRWVIIIFLEYIINAIELYPDDKDTILKNCIDIFKNNIIVADRLYF